MMNLPQRILWLVVSILFLIYFIDFRGFLHQACTHITISDDPSTLAKQSKSGITDFTEIDDTNGTILILMWTGWFWGPPEEGPLKTCSRPNCFLTNNHSMLNQSSAVVFHSRNINWRDMPAQRHSNQSFVFFNWEPPYRTGGNFSEEWKKRYFNLTMTYRRDSDVYAPYGNVIKRRTPLREDLKALAAKKTKQAAWLVSNCNSPSGREILARKLQNHVQVDIYGACGPNKCSDFDGCGRHFEINYRFYLSFENSLCKDYVTEKFFLHLRWYLVPVVLERRHYEQFCPEYKKPWFVAADDFQSVGELGRYLNYLAQNATAYYEYLSWHEQYEPFLHQASSNILGVTTNHWCDLCQVAATRRRRAETLDVFNWWQSDCDNSHKYFHEYTQ